MSPGHDRCRSRSVITGAVQVLSAGIERPAEKLKAQCFMRFAVERFLDPIGQFARIGFQIKQPLATSIRHDVSISASADRLGRSAVWHAVLKPSACARLVFPAGQQRPE